MATKALDEAEALDPDIAHMLSAKAILLMVSGRYEEAERYARRALAIDPRDPSGYKALAQLTSGRLTKEELAGLEALVGDEELRLLDRVTGAFALADCREVQGESAHAFAAYEFANRLARDYGEAEGVAYDSAAREKQIDEVVSLFDSVPAKPARDSEPRAVFIVGMPRSGTTLVESVIGAHSKVFACGERGAVRWIMQDVLSRARAAPPSRRSTPASGRSGGGFWQGECRAVTEPRS